MAPKKEEVPKSDGRNEYIPSFIAKKPFYIDDATASQEDYLQHQRLQQEKNQDPLATSKWYDRGKQQGPAATKYRKGACENCGAMTHKSKDCLQRKRKLGAKWTGKNIAADEVIEDIKLGWDAKRDRWNGYDAAQYEEVIEDFKSKEGNGGERYEEETDMGRQQSTATRSLRLREDTAKYLLNLDVDSAEYDPKTRSIQDAVDGKNDLIAEEGFERSSGDAGEFERAQQYAWETQERGDKDKLHLQANPTVAEFSRKRKAEEDAEKKEAKRLALLNMYGDQDAVKTNPLKDAISTSERYVEYDDRGRIKGEKATKRKSMYKENVFINNHTSVWGSWWKDSKWGYSCCHSTVKNSFCTGEEGRRAMEEAEAFSRGEVKQIEEVKESATNNQEVSLVEKTEPDAASKERVRELQTGVSEAEMDEYRRQRVSKNDPMAGMLGQDGLLSEQSAVT